MKRSQASSPTLGSPPQHKKAKTYPSVAQGLVQDAGIDNDDGEWTKVEKRKQKKVKKAEVKLDVRCFIFLECCEVFRSVQWIPDQEFTNVGLSQIVYGLIDQFHIFTGKSTTIHVLQCGNRQTKPRSRN